MQKLWGISSNATDLNDLKKNIRVKTIKAEGKKLLIFEFFYLKILVFFVYISSHVTSRFDVYLHKLEIVVVPSNGKLIIDSITVNCDCFGCDRNALRQRHQILPQNSKIPIQLSFVMRSIASIYQF